jgi:MFS family permease
MGTFAMVAVYAVFYLSTVFALGYGTGTLGYARPTFLLFECIAVCFMALGIVVSGAAADRFGRRPVLLSGMAAVFGLAFLMGPMLGHAAGTGTWPPVLGFLCLALLSMGWVFGPMGAVLPELFPTRVRYTGASVTYNLAGILGASGAPYIAQELVNIGGIGFVGIYLGVAAILSFLAVLAMPETAGR